MPIQTVESKNAMAEDENGENNPASLEQVLYTKERFAISDAAYHELSILQYLTQLTTNLVW